jgi:hypothetical protein
VNCSGGFAVIGASSIRKRREHNSRHGENGKRQSGEHGYDTANVGRNDFGATLVEDPVRLYRLRDLLESECGPSKAGPHFFCAVFRFRFCLRFCVWFVTVVF